MQDYLNVLEANIVIFMCWQSEEKWRVEKTELKATLTEVEKSHDQLVRSKSCSHDNEYLSRQEDTLKSVHEKLEASLKDKDQNIEKLQAEVCDIANVSLVKIWTVEM